MYRWEKGYPSIIFFDSTFVIPKNFCINSYNLSTLSLWSLPKTWGNHIRLFSEFWGCWICCINELWSCSFSFAFGENSDITEKFWYLLTWIDWAHDHICFFSFLSRSDFHELFFQTRIDKLLSWISESNLFDSTVRFIWGGVRCGCIWLLSLSKSIFFQSIRTALAQGSNLSLQSFFTAYIFSGNVLFIFST